MSDWLREHPVAAAILAVAVFVVWTLPVWLGQVWPLFSKQTLPDWLSQYSGQLGVTPTLHFIGTGILTLVVLAVFVVAISVRRAPADYRRFASDRTETISKRFYENEMVEMDGKIFDRCEFKNVTFVYHGLANCTFVNSKFNYTGMIYVQTDNAAAKGMSSLLAMLQNLPGVTEVFVGEKDDAGRVTILAHEMRRPAEQPDAKPQ